MLRVLEVDNSSLRIDGTVSGLPVWPENAPRLDGVIVCYDVSQEASFAHVEDLLSKHVLGIFIVHYLTMLQRAFGTSNYPRWYSPVNVTLSAMSNRLKLIPV